MNAAGLHSAHSHELAYYDFYFLMQDMRSGIAGCWQSFHAKQYTRGLLLQLWTSSGSNSYNPHTSDLDTLRVFALLDRHGGKIGFWGWVHVCRIASHFVRFTKAAFTPDTCIPDTDTRCINLYPCRRLHVSCIDDNFKLLSLTRHHGDIHLYPDTSCSYEIHVSGVNAA